jgi:DNA-binding transcriptional LysR family regulator
MRDIDIKTLRLLVAVCELQNIKHAAAQENIEPSAISKRIAQLEASLGTAILVRNRRGVQATPAGLALLDHARTVLFTMDRIESDMAAFTGGARGHVRVVASASAIAEALLDDVASFMRLEPNRNVKVDIEEGLSRDIVHAVRDGRAAVGVCWDTADFEALRRRPYRRDQLALAVHAGHPLATRKSLMFKASLQYQHVGLQANSAVHRTLQRAAAQEGVSLDYRVIVSNFDAAFRAVAANLGVSVIPVQVGSAYASLGEVRLIPLADSWAARRFAVCFKDEKGLQPAALRMVEHLVSRANLQH